jgi:hypothetical protein
LVRFILRSLDLLAAQLIGLLQTNLHFALHGQH